VLEEEEEEEEKVMEKRRRRRMDGMIFGILNCCVLDASMSYR